MINRLQWRLTFSYMLVTLATMLLVGWWAVIGISLLSDVPASEVLFILQTLLWPWAGVLIIPAMLGSGLIGFITARWIAHRLEVVNTAASAWSQGDFSVTVNDPSDDEIGRLGRRLNQMADQLEELLARQQTMATLEERNRLARDLHDSVKQQVFAAVMQIGAGRALLAAHPEQAESHLAQAEALGRSAQKELANLILELGPTHLENRPLDEAVQAYLRDWSRQNAVIIHTVIDDAPSLPMTVEQTLFRMVQEALANVAKHSGAKSVTVDITTQADTLHLSIRDDGCGFDPSTVAGGHGLQNMRERIEHINGRFAIQAASGEGTHITVEIDL